MSVTFTRLDGIIPHMTIITIITAVRKTGRITACLILHELRLSSIAVIPWNLLKNFKLNNTGNVRIVSYTQDRSCNHCCSGKAVRTYSESVFVALGIQHARRMRRIILSPVACPTLPYFIIIIIIIIIIIKLQLG
jgi:hypothetical protein